MKGMLQDQKGDTMDEKEFAMLLLKTEALKFNVAQPFTFSSGIKSPIYIDCRQLISDVDVRERIVEGLIELIGECEFEFLAATASAGIPWACWMADKMKKPMVYVRSQQKVHGLKREIEGNPQKDVNYWVIEDLISTGGSSLSTVSTLKKNSCIVKGCISIFTYTLDEAYKSFEAEGIKTKSLSSFSSALDAAVELEVLSSEEADKARLWQNNPRRWMQ